MREIDPDVAWQLPEQLLAAIFDATAWANYQRAGGKGTKPKPIARPGVTPTARKYGKTTETPERVREILDAYSRGDYDKPSRPRDARGRFIRREVSDGG